MAASGVRQTPNPLWQGSKRYLSDTASLVREVIEATQPARSRQAA